jgi:hypothetical protein
MATMMELTPELRKHSRVIASEARQSSGFQRLDCFVASLLAMTVGFCAALHPLDGPLASMKSLP